MKKTSVILKKLGYCGLNCEKCFANVNGDIKKHSKELKNFLGKFEIYSERFVNLLNEPKFLNYPSFKELLDYFADGNCRGCRIETCILFKSCKVRECAEVKSVNFCFECEEFPCNKTGFDEHLRKRWVIINEKMRDSGVQNYYNEIKNQPRY